MQIKVKDTMENTPIPWEVKHSDSKPAYNIIGTMLGGKYKIARCPYLVMPDATVDAAALNERNKREAKADAELIVTAVNNHASLKQQLSALQVENERLKEVLKVELWAMENGEAESQRQGKPRLTERLEMIRELLQSKKP